MASPSLVDRATALGERLRELLDLMPDEDPLYRPVGGADVPSFLFEVYVCSELLTSLQSRATIGVVKRGGAIVLSRSPANKSNKSYFTVHFEAGRFHLCPGIKVLDRFGNTQAPDLSLQNDDSGDEPTWQNVRAIWDAKLRGDSGAPASESLSKSEVSLFTYMLDALRVPKPGSERDVLQGWPPAFEVCALITNGQGSSHTDEVFFEKGFSVTSRFAGASTQCRPTQAQHVHRGREGV